MKLLGLDRVLCLSPHPDDVEYGMAGTVLKHTSTDFTVLTMSIGSKGDLMADDSRRNEVRDFWRKIRGDVALEFASVDYIGEQGMERWLKSLEGKPSEFSALFVPPAADSHYEHRFVHDLAWALCRACKTSIVTYATPSTLNSWSPTLFVDIRKQLKRKLDALEGFCTQTHHHYFERKVLEAFHTNFQAAKKGIRSVERFRAEEIHA